MPSKKSKNQWVVTETGELSNNQVKDLFRIENLHPSLPVPPRLIIGIVQIKGGVGKTTLTELLAEAIYATSLHKLLVVSLDLYLDFKERKLDCPYRVIEGISPRIDLDNYDIVLIDQHPGSCLEEISNYPDYFIIPHKPELKVEHKARETADYVYSTGKPYLIWFNSFPRKKSLDKSHFSYQYYHQNK